MIHKHLSLLAIAVALLMPISVLATPPLSVTGIGAVKQTDGKVRITWQAVQGSDIASYRIYSSRMSILENDGAYDDFEATDGPVTEKILQDFVPSAGKTYFGVMAVNKGGEESAFFMEETSLSFERVSLSPSSAPSTTATQSLDPFQTPSPVSSAPALPTKVSAAVSSSSAATIVEPVLSSSASTPSSVAISIPPEGPLHLLSVKPLSATRITLEFSLPIITDPEAAGKAMTIGGPGGTILPIEQITIDGSTIELQTPRQTAGMVYEIQIGDALKGEGSSALDAVERTAFFQGHDTGNPSPQTEPTAQEQQLPPAGMIADFLDFRMEAVPDPSAEGKFLVTVQWTYAPNAPADASVIVRQSRDGGRTFSPPQYLKRTMTGVQFPGVTRAPFGVGVALIDTKGRPFMGRFSEVFSNAYTNAPHTLASIIPVQKSSSALPGSGLGAGLLLTAMAGGIAGWRKAKRGRA